MSIGYNRRRSEGFQAGDEIIVRVGESLECVSELEQFTVSAGTQGTIVEVTSSGTRKIKWQGKQGEWALAPQCLRKLQMIVGEEDIIVPKIVEKVRVADTQDGVGLVSPPLRQTESISLDGVLIPSDLASIFPGERVASTEVPRYQKTADVPSISSDGVCNPSGTSVFPEERVVIREVPRYKTVDKIVDVPKAAARERIVEVPLALHSERIAVHEVPTIVESSKSIAVVKCVSTPISVPKVSLAPSVREEAVRMTLREEFLQEETIVTGVEISREVAAFNEEVRRKEVVKKQLEFKERLEKVEAVTTKEEIHEVVQRQPFSLDVETPKEVIEKVERPVSIAKIEVQQRSEELDVIQIKENVIETPEKVIIELIKEVPKFITQYIEKKVPKIVYEYVEVEQEVTHHVTEEEIVYVPEVIRIEAIREVAVPVVQQVDKKMPKYISNVKEKIVEYHVPIKKEVGVYEDCVEDVTVVTQQLCMQQETTKKTLPRYIRQAKEVLEDVCCKTRCERPKVIMQKAYVDVVREQPNLLVEKRACEVRTDVFVPVQKEVAVPIDLTEEVVELVPQVQSVSTLVEEIIEERQQEIVATPVVKMEYVLEEVAVDRHIHSQDFLESDRHAFQIEPEDVRTPSPVPRSAWEVARAPSPEIAYRRRSPSPVWKATSLQARAVDEKDAAAWVAREARDAFHIEPKIVRAPSPVRETPCRPRSPRAVREAISLQARALDEKDAAAWVATQATQKPVQEIAHRQRLPSLARVTKHAEDEKEAADWVRADLLDKRAKLDRALNFPAAPRLM